MMVTYCIDIVKNHGIPEQKTQDALAAAKQFFSLPMEEKMKEYNLLYSNGWYWLKIQLDLRGTANFKGYSPLLSGNNDPENSGDLQEGFEIGWEPLFPGQKNGAKPDGVMAGDNRWPSGMPEFRVAILEY
jgi:isopenicillin N synthase-like dioxygenase